MENKTVVIGLSGGVDSSAAAYLLKQQGYRVIGITMNMWEADNEKNGKEEENTENDVKESKAVCDARRVAETLGIEYHVLDFREVFRNKVVCQFLGEYEAGRTPNPCVFCNRTVKFEALLEEAGKLGADYIATGHYAKIKKLPNGRFSVANAEFAGKDQTYALCRLSQDQLAHTLMPVGEYEKEEVRKIAALAGIHVAEKKDSQDICFIPDGDYASFIRREGGKEEVPGNFVDASGNILGRHKGIIHYTIGQRKGLGIAFGVPMFVSEIRPYANEVVLSSNEELFEKELYAKDVNFMGLTEFDPKEELTGKIRYSHKGAPCFVENWGDNGIHCVFQEPQRAITPGQTLVLYKDGCVMAGATICRKEEL